MKIGKKEIHVDNLLILFGVNFVKVSSQCKLISGEYIINVSFFVYRAFYHVLVHS